ncbi:MAG: hypothetical protein EXR72_08800 [Myxococcales bacterium]|nr:hypothetical protein [Myxococcales bacterium]
MKIRLFVLLASLYLLGASREQPWGDARVVYETSQRLVDELRVDIVPHGPPQFYAHRPKTPEEKRADLAQRWKKQGKKGTPRLEDVLRTPDEQLSFGVFPLGNVVAMVPGYLAWKALRQLPGAPEELLFRYTSHLPTSLLVAGACVIFFSLARRQGASERAAFWLALGLGTTTVLVVYARSPFSEALQTLAFTWVVERGLTVGDRLTKRGALFTGVACGLLFNTKLVYALALPVVALHIAWCHRQDLRRLVVAALYAALPMAFFVGVAVAHNWYKTRTLLDTGYQIPEGVFSGNAYAALHGFFFSTGKSIFLYSPLLVLGALALPSYLRTHRRRGLFLLVLTGVVTLANAKFRYWHADYCWGPRLLVPLTPAFLLPAAPWIEGALARGRRRLRALGLGLLVGAGLFVQLLGSSFYWDHYIRIAIAVKDQTGAPGWYTEDLHHCHFIPQFSPILGHAWLLRHFVLSDDDLLADPPWRRVVAGKVNLGNEWSGTTLDWWAWDWIVKDHARGYGVALAGLLLNVGGWAAWSLRRRLRAGPHPDARGA